MPTTAPTRVLTLTAVLAAVAAGAGLLPQAAAAADSGRVRPGATVSVAGNTCTAGFLVHKRRKGREYVYVAIPAGCLGTDEGTAASGCAEAQVPPGTAATIAGARHQATVAYSSYSTMQLRGTTSADTCAGNSLALLKLSRTDARRSSPVVPVLGRPAVVSGKAPANGATLNALIGGAKASGTAGATSSGGWQHQVRFTTNMLSASDMGAPVLTTGRRPVGMLTTLPTPFTLEESTVADLLREMRYLRTVTYFHHAHLMRRHHP